MNESQLLSRLSVPGETCKTFQRVPSWEGSPHCTNMGGEHCTLPCLQAYGQLCSYVASDRMPSLWALSETIKIKQSYRQGSVSHSLIGSNK